MVKILIGNALCFAGMTTDSISAARKTPRDMLIIQNISQVIYCVSAVLLGAYSAAVQNVVNILRNTIAIQNKQTRVVEGVLIAFGVVFGLIFNNLGLWGVVPVLASMQYSLTVLIFKQNAQALRLSFAANMICYTVFNAYIWNIGGVIANLVVLVSTSVCYLKERKK